MILELVEDLPEEKLGKVISFIKFIKEEEEPILVLESEDEEDILNILREDEWYSSEEIEKKLSKVKKMNNVNYSKQAKKSLESYDYKISIRIKNAIDKMPLGDIKKACGK